MDDKREPYNGIASHQPSVCNNNTGVFSTLTRTSSSLIIHSMPGNFLNSVLCYLFICVQLCVASGLQKQRGLIVIPGLGRSDRLTTVTDNLRILQQNYMDAQNIKWDCRVYIYAKRDLTSFWFMDKELKYLRSLCEIVEVPDQLVTENLHMVNPTELKQLYQYVMIFLDDCKIQDAQTFNLARIVHVMEQQNLTVASPMIVGANKGVGFRKIMQTPPLPGTEGFVSTFVEIFVMVMTMPAYTALWELFCPEINPYAWGYDFWYDRYALERVAGHKMGIIATSKVDHVQSGKDSTLGRTDKTDEKVKWRAVLRQERHYKKKLNVPLNQYRAQMRLANASWNGSVQNYIPIIN